MGIDKKTVRITADQEGMIIGTHARPAEKTSSLRERTLVLMLHGFPGHKSAHNALYGDLEFLLNDHGFHTLRFDFRGCGESSGREENFSLTNSYADLRIIMGWAQTKNYRRFVLIGEGLGATLALSHMTSDIACMLLFWPVLDMLDYAQKTLKGDGKYQPDETGIIHFGQSRIGKLLIEELENRRLPDAAMNPTCPILIMHGAQDTQVPVHNLDILRKFVKSGRIDITSFQDGAHGLTNLNHRKTMYHLIPDFIQKYA